MNLTFMLTGLTIIAVSLLILNGLKNKRELQQNRHILTKVKRLKLLISLLQKHRGKNAANIKGDQQAKQVITGIQTQLKPLIEELNSEPFITNQERWLGFSDHWPRLENSAANLTLEKSFIQHTHLIANLLYLFEDLAEHEHFNKSSFESLPNISLLWRELPFTAEYIGQSRAMGVAIAATGASTQVDKVKLGYLEKKITELSSTVFKQFKNKGAHSKEQSQLLLKASEECLNLTSTIKLEFIDCTKVKIKSDTFFIIASSAMEAINSLLDYELKQVELHLESI
ncbi:hypothetical protein [Paraglaciecola marina]|uniref:hypothetical protein n=1 Tax=Paraglaciecola marina TaxID=2500157 RepID=UPI0010608B68|nr:hypothetical protein [Paraglaciecola marina]